MKQSLFPLPFFPFLLLPLFLKKKKNGRSRKARVFKGLKEKRKEEEEPLFSGFGEKCPSSSYFLARKRPWKKEEESSFSARSDTFFILLAAKANF